jgi:hypothetical protein
MLINPYRYSSPGGGGLLLDNVTGALGAYSLTRKLRTAYSGNCIKINRDSNGNESNIGFSGNDIDSSAISTFCSGTTGRAITIYDQSGNGNDITLHTSYTAGAVVYSGGTLKSVNGKQSMYVDQNPYFQAFYETPSGFLNGATALTFLMVSKIPNPSGSNRGIFAPSTTNSVGLEILQLKVISIDTAIRFNASNRNSGSNVLLGDDVQSLSEIYADGTSVSAYYNGNSVTLSDSSAMPTLNHNGVYAWGRYSSSATIDLAHLQELIIFDSNKSSQRSAIESDINGFYSIY